MEYNYIYSLEQIANINLNWNDICFYHNTNVLYILCYHIEKQTKYPFIQFMMEKIPFCDNIIQEQFILPYKMLKGYSGTSDEDLKTTILNEIKMRLNSISCNGEMVTDDMYKGVVYGIDCITPYVLVNISSIDIYGLHLSRNTSTWFALTSEIINTRTICDIIIDPEVTELFVRNPTMGVLTNTDTNEIFMLPDAVYTGGEFVSVEFNSVFGNRKTKVYETCGEYFYFYRDFHDAIKDGGWLPENGKNMIGTREITERSSNKYKKGGINRYALFVEGNLYMEDAQEFSLDDNAIDNSYPEPCIIICYNGKHKLKPNILAKFYNSFVCISYHNLDKKLLGDHYDECVKYSYMIL